MGFGQTVRLRRIADRNSAAFTLPQPLVVQQVTFTDKVATCWIASTDPQPAIKRVTVNHTIETRAGRRLNQTLFLKVGFK
jgi:hypothetical protein